MCIWKNGARPHFLDKLNGYCFSYLWVWFPWKDFSYVGAEKWGQAPFHLEGLFLCRGLIHQTHLFL
jgi:hypothetical protein